MSLIDKIKDIVVSPLTAVLMRRNPVLKAAVLRSSELWNSAGYDRVFNEETKNALSEQLWIRLQDIIRDANPVMKCRQALCDAVLELSNYQVLVLPPPPELDTTGLRGTQGITGELKPRLLEISEKNETLRELVYGAFPGKPTYEEVWNLVAGLHWRNAWWTETINAARNALGDCNAVQDRDWYRPFLHAMCVFAEDTYRKDIGMPPAIPGDGFPAPLVYSSLLQAVLRGDRYPDLSWRELYGDMIARGELRPPFPADRS
jgi:hypothetical protein